MLSSICKKAPEDLKVITLLDIVKWQKSSSGLAKHAYLRLII